MRALKAVISLKNLKNNYLYLKQLHGNKLLAVVKADAYGHGVENCSKYIADVTDGFAVAFLEEAIVLRDLGIQNNIVILEGVFDQQEYNLVEKHKLYPVIHNNNQLTWFCSHNWKNKIKEVWLKVDIGMNRLGFSGKEFIKAYNILYKSKFVENIIKMSHFCCADNDSDEMTNFQIKLFNNVMFNLSGEESLANSAGILRFPNCYRNWGRAGISLYGISPFNFNSKINTSYLKPVMLLKSKIFSVKRVLKGQGIGYGHNFIADYDMQIGIVACGYADGYPRLNINNNPCLINGIKSRIIGNISMDMLVVELNDKSQGIGSEVELWGENICINGIAKNAHTIAYELLCHVKRANKEYLY